MFFNKIHIRIRAVFFIFFVIMLVIITKVLYIEVISYNKLKTLSDNLYTRNLPIMPDRGLIYDRNGKILADNITTTSLVIVPRQVKDKEEAAKKIAQILNISKDNILKHFNKRVSIEKVHPEGRNLSYDIAEKIEKLNIDGVYLIKESKRYYPYKSMLSHSLGYVGIDNQGLSGLELIYDDYLKGNQGAIKYYSDGQGNKLAKEESYEAPKDGMSITLTIDLDIQKAIENELDNLVAKYNPENALIIVQDPSTGEILGMSSRPTFDSNNYKSSSENVINRNLPIWMTYEPGSTFKIITLASAIEENVVDLFNDTYYDSGSVSVDGSKLHCWKTKGHGKETYLEVVQNSCNPGFVSLGLKLGKDKLMNYIKKFGFGSKTGIDLNGESNGILFDINKMGLVETATTAFGQGISVTPIQQITGISAAINGGNLYEPFIVKNIFDSSTGSVYLTNEKVFKRKVISDKTSDVVRFALENVVAKGTGKNAYIENYRVGGKTGTAQKVYNGAYMQGNYILSFIGFMPADNPRAVVYVAVDHPKNVTQYGGTVAAPVAKNIFKSVINTLGIKPSKESIPKNYTYLDQKYLLVPNVVGLNVNDAKKALKGFKLSYSGAGDTVLYQSPDAETYTKENGVVMLLLGDK